MSSRARAPMLAFILAVAAPIGAGHLAGQAAPSVVGLTLQEAVESALESHPGIRAARFGAEAAAAAANGAAAVRWPTIALSASAIRYQEPLPVTPIHGFTPGVSPAFDRDLFQGGTSLRYTVFDGLGRRGRIEAARQESAAVAFNVTGSAHALVAGVTGSYLAVLGGARVLEAQDRRLAALEAERSRARQLLEVGRAATVEVLRVESSLAGAQAERVTLAAAVEVSEQDLSRLTGLPVARTRADSLAPVVMREVAVPPREALLAAALLANPAILQQQRRIAASDARGMAVRSARWPKVDLAVNYLAWASPENSPTAEWNAGVAISLPLFTGGAVRYQVEASEAEVSAAHEQLRLAESDLGQELDRALSSVHEARARVTSLATAVERSQEVARIEQLRLDSGTGVQRDYLDAEAALFGNRAAAVQAQYSEILARVRLAQITGELGPEWLSTVLGGTP